MAKEKKTTKKNQKLLDGQAYVFLENYINNPSPVGFETSGQRLWLEYIKPYVDSTMVDVYGTSVGIINPEHPFKVVIEAHADEIGWFVNYISDNGFIYVKRNGGADHQIAPSMRVFIHGRKGTVKGVFGWPAIHTRHAESLKNIHPETDNIWIDCGAKSKKDAEEMGLHVGATVTYQDKFDRLANGFLVGRAFDNRIGGFMIAQVAKMLKEKNVTLPFGLYIVNAVQEEIGLRGAEMIARRIKPNVAIITDVTHDTQTPMLDKKIHGDTACGKGPALTFGPAVQNKLLEIIEKTAEKNKIPVQLQAASRSTGTDTDSFAYANDGCPSALISIPLRYMHTTVEMIHESDIENTIRLIYETLLQITPRTKFHYL